jgi:ribosome-associated heat shock protein Hsp15
LPADPTCRLDVWLWRARLFKSRARATAFCIEEGLRINRIKTGKAHHPVRPGDVLTLAVGAQVRVLRVAALGTRRGPASEARSLYEDLDSSRLAALRGPAL